MKIVKQQKVTLTFGSGDTVQNGTLSGFTTLAQIVPHSASSEVDAVSASSAECEFDLEITSTTNVRATRGGSGVAATVIVYVVEFASDVNVYKNTWALGTGDTADDNAITAVTLANAYCWHFQKTTGGVLQPNVRNTASELQSTTNVRIHVNTSGTAHDGHWYVVEHSDLSVQRGTNSTDSSPTNITITSVTLANAFSIMSNTSTETQYEDEGNEYAQLTTTTNLQCYSGFTSGGNTRYWQVIEDTDFTVQRFSGRNTTTASGNQTITSVDTDFAIVQANHMISVNSSSVYNQAHDLSCRSTSYDLTTATNVAWAKDANNGSWVFEVIEFTEEVASSASSDQTSFRGRNDDGSETSATWKAAVNTNWSQRTAENFKVRFLVQEDNDVEDLNVQFQLQYNLNSAGWNDVNGSSSVVRSNVSSEDLDGADTTQLLGSGTFITNNDCMDEVNGLVGGANLDWSTTVNQEVEAEFCCQIRDADTSNGDTIQLRLVKEADSAFAAYTNTPTVTVMIPSYDQTSFRGRNDDGSETAATWKAAVNTNWNQVADQNFRIRFLVQEDNDSVDENVQFQLQYNLESAGWNDVNGASSVVRSFASANFADGADTTQLIGSGTFISNNDCMDEVNGLVGGANLDWSTTANQEVEAEFCCQIRSADVDRGETLQLRLVKEADTALTAYTNTPTLTVPIGAGMQLASAELLQTTAGAENPGIFDFERSLPWGAITLALRKASAGSVTELDFDNVNVNGDVWNDNTSANLQINSINSSSLTAGDPGTGNGQTDIQNAVTLTVTVKSYSTGAVLEGASVYGKLVSGDGGAVVMNGVTNASGVYETTYNFASEVDLDTSVSAVRSSSGGVPYQDSTLGGTITSNGYATTILLIDDN